MLGSEKADNVVTYGGGTLGIIIANLPAINSVLQFILLVLSIAAMGGKLYYDIKNRWRS